MRHSWIETAAATFRRPIPVALCCAGLFWGTSAVGHAAEPPAPDVIVSLAQHAPAAAIPPSFLGVSSEYWSLPLFEQQSPLFRRALALLQVSGWQPPALRIGGDSADRSSWLTTARGPAGPDYRLTRTWLRHTSALVASLGSRVILDLNLATGSPRADARFAAAAVAAFPAGSIRGFELGNEPDLYGSGFSAVDYVRDFRSFGRALSRVDRLVPLIGPALSEPSLNFSWLSSLVAGDRRQLAVLSAHRYPLVPCDPPSAPRYPTIARVLSEQSTAGMARTVRDAVRLAHRHGIPFALTEVNSVTCGGLAGVSDTFSTALWAPDALFEYLRAGVDATYVHIRARAINAPFVLDRSGLQARPLLYGLALFARTLGQQARLVSVHVHGDRGAHVKVWAVQLPGGLLHVLAINKGSRASNLELRLPASAPAEVERMLAPSPSAPGAVSLDGQHLAPDGSWAGSPVTDALTRSAGGYRLTLPGFSAALVSVPLAPGALGASQPIALEIGV